MKHTIFILCFVFAQQLSYSQPECFKVIDSSQLSSVNLSALATISDYYVDLPANMIHILTPSSFSFTIPIDSSLQQLELLAWSSDYRHRAFFLPYYARQIATDSAKIEAFLSCAINDTGEMCFKEGCLINPISSACYTYYLLQPHLTSYQWERLTKDWLKKTSIRDLKEALLTTWSKQENYSPFFRELIRNHNSYEVFNYLLYSPEPEDKELLIECAKVNPLKVHNLMMQYPDSSYIPYVKSQLRLTPDYAHTEDLMYIAENINETFYKEVTDTICKKLNATKIYSFGQYLYNSAYYEEMAEDQKKQLLLKLLPSLKSVDSSDIYYLTKYQRSAFDESVTIRLTENFDTIVQPYLNGTLDLVFTQYTENWTEEKQTICRQLCEGCKNRTAVLATIALLEHNDTRTSELLFRHFQQDTANQSLQDYPESFYSIEAMTYSNDSILFQKVGAVLLQQFLGNDLHSDPFNYLYILDRSLIPGFYELLLKDLEKGPLTYKHTATVSFLLTKNNAAINKRLVANYQTLHNQDNSNYYNTEIGFYLTEYGLLGK